MLVSPAIGIRNVADGTSNSFAFGEWRIGDGNTGINVIPSDIAYVGKWPAGVARNTPQLELPAMTQPVFLQWVQT
jgi:hypothetical protein